MLTIPPPPPIAGLPTSNHNLILTNPTSHHNPKPNPNPTSTTTLTLPLFLQHYKGLESGKARRREMEQQHQLEREMENCTFSPQV